MVELGLCSQVFPGWGKLPACRKLVYKDFTKPVWNTQVSVEGFYVSSEGLYRPASRRSGGDQITITSQFFYFCKIRTDIGVVHVGKEGKVQTFANKLVYLHHV